MSFYPGLTGVLLNATLLSRPLCDAKLRRLRFGVSGFTGDWYQARCLELQYSGVYRFGANASMSVKKIIKVRFTMDLFVSAYAWGVLSTSSLTNGRYSVYSPACSNLKSQFLDSSTLSVPAIPAVLVQETGPPSPNDGLACSSLTQVLVVGSFIHVVTGLWVASVSQFLSLQELQDGRPGSLARA